MWNGITMKHDNRDKKPKARKADDVDVLRPSDPLKPLAGTPCVSVWLSSIPKSA